MQKLNVNFAPNYIQTCVETPCHRPDVISPPVNTQLPVSHTNNSLTSSYWGCFPFSSSSSSLFMMT